MTTNTKMPATERYKKQGLQHFACWLPPEVVQKIKMLASIKQMKIPEVIVEQFSDITVKTTKDKSGTITVRFCKEKEEERSTV